MNKDKLNQLVKLQKDFRELYRDSSVGVAGVADMGVHLTLESFVATFNDYNTHTRDSEIYPIELQTEYEGVLFFCILKKEQRHDDWYDYDSDDDYKHY